jgi:8-oxo-dGTP diphosphatase
LCGSGRAGGETLLFDGRKAARLLVASPPGAREVRIRYRSQYRPGVADHFLIVDDKRHVPVLRFRSATGNNEVIAKPAGVTEASLYAAVEDAVSRSLTLAHSWRAGELLVVDNRRMLHSRAPFGGLRHMLRFRYDDPLHPTVLLIHPDDPDQCLIVRHSYSDSAWWGMPGGGCRPGRETPEQAVVREVFEELALTVTEVPIVLDTVNTTLEGKHDTLTIVQATPVSASFVRSPEIAEARWVRADLAAMPEGEPVSRWLKRALAVRNAPDPGKR